MSEKEVQAIIVRALKTFIQAFLAVFLLGLTPVASNVLQTGNISGAKTALLALATASLAAGISAITNAFIKPVEAK